MLGIIMTLSFNCSAINVSSFYSTIMSNTAIIIFVQIVCFFSVVSFPWYSKNSISRLKGTLRSSFFFFAFVPYCQRAYYWDDFCLIGRYWTHESDRSSVDGTSL